MDRRVSIVLFIGIAVVVVLVCVCLSAVLLGGGVFVFSALTEPYDVTVSAVAPTQVEKGDSLVIRVVIENPTSDSQVLDSIDIDLAYLDGIHIQRTEPPYRSTFSLSPLLEQQSYEFKQAIPADSELTVQLYGSALKAGDFSGRIDVCINTGGNCQGYHIRTVVEE